MILDLELFDRRIERELDGGSILRPRVDAQLDQVVIDHQRAGRGAVFIQSIFYRPARGERLEQERGIVADYVPHLADAVRGNLGGEIVDRGLAGAPGVRVVLIGKHAAGKVGVAGADQDQVFAALLHARLKPLVRSQALERQRGREELCVGRPDKRVIGIDRDQLAAVLIHHQDSGEASRAAGRLGRMRLTRPSRRLAWIWPAMAESSISSRGRRFIRR